MAVIAAVLLSRLDVRNVIRDPNVDVGCSAGATTTMRAAEKSRTA